MRVLLIVVFVPVAIVVGVLASAVLGNSGSAPRGPRAAPAAPRPGQPVAAQPAVRSPAQAPAAPPAATPAPPPAARSLPAVPAPPPPAAAAPAPVVPPAAAVAPPAAPARPPAAPVAVPPPPAATEPPSTAAPDPSYAPAGSERRDVGSGAQSAAIFRRPGTAGKTAPVVIFLHGWVAIDPRRYGAWIGHLVQGGATVIYPAYQTKPSYDTITPLANLLAGVRAALAHVQLEPGRLVVAGHSAGGALAADYASVAAANNLPAPAAVFSVYPGRKLKHLAVPIPAIDLRTIAPGTRVVALAGERDSAVGTGTAKRIVAGAVHAEALLHIVRDDAVDDHAAPRRFDAAAQRTFWEPLDELIAATAAGVAPTTGGALAP